MNVKMTKERLEASEKLTAFLLANDRGGLSWRELTEKFLPGHSNREWSRGVYRQLQKVGGLSGTPQEPEVATLPIQIKTLFEKRSSYTLEELSDVLDMSISKVRAALQEAMLAAPGLSIDNGTVQYKAPQKEEKPVTVTDVMDRRRENATIKAQTAQIKVLADELDRVNDALDVALAIKATTDFRTHKIDWNNTIHSEAVALVQFSDWHVGKRIDKRTTNGMNEYNPDIAKQRSEKITVNLLKLITKERKDIKIENLVINLGGDAINNFLHEGDAQQNYMAPLEEVRFAKQLIGNSLKTIAENGEFKKITLLCQRGNHPRLTKKMQPNVDYKMNYEAMLYWILQEQFSDSLFEWHVPESDIGYYYIGEGKEQKTLRYFHGHQVGFQGGIGGLTIPMMKKIMYWDKTIKAHYDMVSHWHRFQFIEQRASVNSSLCGWDEYAQSCGFPYEPVTQTLQLLDRKRGLTGRFPIFAE